MHAPTCDGCRAFAPPPPPGRLSRVQALLSGLERVSDLDRATWLVTHRPGPTPHFVFGQIEWCLCPLRRAGRPRGGQGY